MMGGHGSSASQMHILFSYAPVLTSNDTPLTRPVSLVSPLHTLFAVMPAQTPRPRHKAANPPTALQQAACLT